MKIIQFIKFVFVSIPLAILVYTTAIILQGIINLYKTIKKTKHGHWK